jgi:phosphotransferase system enzyme I (PtsP)
MAKSKRSSRTTAARARRGSLLASALDGAPSSSAGSDLDPASSSRAPVSAAAPSSRFAAATAAATGASPAAAGTVRGELLDFIAFVGKHMPLTALLDGCPQRIARILGADVVSIYLLEGGGDGLVLRGNVGFRPEARGIIRLRVGEGLTGLAVKTMQPVVVVRAPRHDAFRRFDELEEDRWPVLLATPIPGPDHRPLGALVVQRRERAFTDHEVHLALALTAPVASAVRHAALLDELRDKVQRKTGGGTRKLTLPGRPVVPGRALGAVAALRRPAKDRKEEPRPADAARISASFDLTRRSLAQLLQRVDRAGLGKDAAFLHTYALMAEDARLRERAVELVRGGASAAEALSNVAREATRAARSIVGDPFLEQRSADMEDLCDVVLMLAAPDLRAAVPSKAVLLGDKVTVFDVLVTARTQPVGIALTSPGDDLRTQVLLRLLGIPAIVDVAMAFRWASPGDIALLDADHGFLVVNPSRAEVAQLRAVRRGTTTTQEGMIADAGGDGDSAVVSGSMPRLLGGFITDEDEE